MTDDNQVELTGSIKRVVDATKVKPRYITKRAVRAEGVVKTPAYTAEAFHVTIKNRRTGYTKLVTRSKAFRYINDFPSLWSITTPDHKFKDIWEEV